MQHTFTHVAMVVDSWFPEMGGKQVHIKNLRAKLHRHFNTKTEIYYSGRTHPLFRLFWPAWIIVKIIRNHRSSPYNLIHSHGVIAGLPAKIASLILRIPVVHTVHGSPHLDMQKNSLQFYLENWILTKIIYDREISVADSFSKYKNRNQNVTIVRNGVDVTAFDKVRVKKYAYPTIIWVGNNIPEKGVAFLKEAVTRIRKSLPKLKTEFVTGGRLTGERLIKAYKRSHVFVLPSLAEGQPITLLEAWAAKLPVIATQVGDNASLIKDGINGILIEPENITQLVKAILKILRSRSKGKNLGMSGYRLVSRKFSWLTTAKQTYGVYKSVLKAA